MFVDRGGVLKTVDETVSAFYLDEGPVSQIISLGSIIEIETVDFA